MAAVTPEERGEWCVFHEQVHEYEVFGPQCQVFGERPQLRPGPGRAGPGLAVWVKRLTVCWWKHRARLVGPGAYLSTGCRACSGW